MLKIMSVALSALALTFFAATANAQSHSPHEHGVANLNLVIEDSGFAVELHGPLANFMSFEHEPSTDEQKQEVKDLAKTLGDASELFITSPESGCTVKSVSLSSEKLPPELLAPYAGEEGEEHHDDQQAADHHHDDGDAEEEHGDIDADYEFVCADVSKLTSIGVNLFSKFASLEEVEAQVISDKGQNSFELTSNENLLEW
jgi:hypothetical protein